MLVVPALTPVTNPVFGTVATTRLDDNQGLAPGVPDPVNCVDDPSQTVNVPVIVGNEFTVTLKIEDLGQVEPPGVKYVIA